MSLLNKQQQTQVADAVREVESRTNAEVVTVLAARSDEYRYIPLLWAAFISIVLPGVLYFIGLDAVFLAWSPPIVFVVVALALQIGTLRVRLIPRGVRGWRAANMARRQFLEQGLHHTDGDTGVLVFVSEAEHYVEILVDRGISAHIENTEWQSIVETFITDVRARRIEEGFASCLEKVGDLLAAAVPKTPDNKNELDNRLILIGYD